MNNKKIILSAIGGLLVLATANSYATQTQVSDEVFAIEATEGSRAVDVLARRGADDPTGTEAPGDNHRQRRGGRLIDTGVDILARRGADDPPGTEAPGDNHRQRRGGRA